jgi:CheY-like chemotaxis protein
MQQAPHHADQCSEGYDSRMWFDAPLPPEPTLAEIKRRSKILVIDDDALPVQRLFSRDEYDIERWPDVKQLEKLTDGTYDVLLLDINGVGRKVSPTGQGLGVLEHIKRTNPAQQVILYSAQAQRISSREILVLADAVLDKESDYVQYRAVVDDLLLRRFTPGYFVSVMNRELGPHAVRVQRAVPKALRAMKSGRMGPFRHYLETKLPDPETVDRIIAIVSMGSAVIAVWNQ